MNNIDLNESKKYRCVFRKIAEWLKYTIYLGQFSIYNFRDLFKFIFDDDDSNADELNENDE